MTTKALPRLLDRKALASVVGFDDLLRDLRHMEARAASDLADWLVHLDLEGKADRTLYVYASSGPLWQSPPSHRRYVVATVSGWGTAASSGHPASTTWTVLDSANAWREVARFVPEWMGRAECSKRAVELAAELNAAEVRRL